MTATVFINGKFAAQAVTGVQRFAIEMTRALDRLVAGRGDVAQFVLLLPPGATPLGLTTIAESTVSGSSRLHLWEQLALPRAARGGILLNLTGSAPLLHPRQIASLLDTAIYAHPEAYTRAFVGWYRLLFGRMARRARLIVTLTEFSRAQLVATLHTRAPIVVVGAAATQLADVAADAAVLRDLGLAGHPFFLAVGSDNPTKNFARLIEAFARVPGTDLRLVIVGGGNAGVFAATTGGDDPRIVRAGRVGDPALKALYEAALAFVFPSIFEGFGLPPLEAMACGCPVIASTAASIPEVCGDAALYVDPFDIAAMAAALIRLTTDDGERKRLIARGRERARVFSWDTSANNLLQAVVQATRTGPWQA